MTRVSVSKLLSKFEEQGLIQLSYKQIRVVDRKGLWPLFGELEFI